MRSMRSAAARGVAVNRNDKAEPFSRRAHAIHDKLFAEHRTNPRYLRQLAWSSSNLGSILLATRKYDEALPLLSRALMIYESLVTDNPGHSIDGGEPLDGLAALQERVRQR